MVETTLAIYRVRREGRVTDAYLKTDGRNAFVDFRGDNVPRKVIVANRYSPSEILESLNANESIRHLAIKEAVFQLIFGEHRILYRNDR